MTNPDFSDQPDGATPIDDVSGLRLRQIRTISELNDAEALNIVAAEEWIQNGRVGNIFQLSFYRGLHRRMLDDVWDWAGQFRVSNLNIGVPYHEAPMRLEQASLDFETQFKADVVPFLEFIAAYHHRLVWVHRSKMGMDDGRVWRATLLQSGCATNHPLFGPQVIWSTLHESERDTLQR